MKIQSLVVIILRVYALHFIINGFCKSIPSLVYLTSMSKQLDIHMFIPWVLTILLFSIGFILWIFALPISKLMTKKLPEKIFTSPIEYIDCYIIAFLGLGLYFAIGNFPDSLFWCLNAFKLKVSGVTFSGENEINYFSILTYIIPFVVGLLLIFKARFWATKLEKYHKKTENSEQSNSGNSVPSSPDS